MTLKIGAYNKQGYMSGINYVKHTSSMSVIIFVQEHWLQASQLALFNSVENNFVFYGKSSIDSAMSKEIIREGPFGGVGVLI
jgi:hypothetical protein